MKKLFCVFITCLLIVSCNSEEQGTVYSTESDLNELELMNKRVISQDITLEEISSYYGDEQKEIFRALTPENRKRLWEEKFDQLLILTNNTEERLLLDRIYDEVKKIDFSISLEDNSEEVSLLNSLIDEGISRFEWDEVYMDITFSSFEFYQVGKRDYRIYELAQHDGDTGGGSIGDNYCTCRWSHPAKSCIDGGCTETEWGCGWFLLQSCTGKFYILW